MASLESLSPDQRAVLELVLKRGRSYDDIAQLLSINRAAVRERALNALDALGPQTRVPYERRGVITDYLLGQLSADQREETFQHLTESASERAWARVLTSELAPLSSGPLPEIPDSSTPEAAEAAEPEPEPSEPGEPQPEIAEPADEAEPTEQEEPASAEAADEAEPTEQEEPAPVAAKRRPPRKPAASATRSRRPPKLETGGARRSSKAGGAVLLAVGALIVVAVVVVLIVSGGSSKHKGTASAHGGTTSTSSSTNPVPLAQINLTPPAVGSKALGIAEVLRQGSTIGIAIVAQNVPANTAHPPNYYAVWLYNSPTDAYRLGFVSPGVGSTGKLEAAGALPSNAAHYKQVIITLETQTAPKNPGKTVLQGTLRGVS